MKNQKEIASLKSRIAGVYEETRADLSKNIKRGHTRSISTDVEDSIALFISSVLKNKVTLYIDPSISIDGKTHRPDILVIKDKTVIALIEIKSNMGWCRDAKKVIDEEIVRKDKIFAKEGLITCKFSKEDLSEVKYGKKVALFLVALTATNGAEKEQNIKNKSYAKSKGVNHYLLFDGWYNNLENRDAADFAEALSKLI